MLAMGRRPSLVSTSVSPRKQPVPTQVPAPLQKPGPPVASVQATLLGGKLPQLPLPSQVPSQAAMPAPQTGRPLTGAVPLPVLVQLPGEVSQRWHWPVQADPQQTPSTQMPEVHSLGALQARPFGLVDLHVGALQNGVADAQLLSMEQLVKQALLEQAKGAQFTCVCALQAPAPLHCAELPCVDGATHD